MAEVQNMPQVSLDKVPFSLRVLGFITRLFQKSGEDPQKMRLISISISHYVEKVRWALELGSNDWTEDGHLPALHYFFTLPVTINKSMTPCLVTREKEIPFISDSTMILKYLCKTDPKLNFLYPPDKEKEVDEIEDFLDQNLGVSLRRFAYSNILRDKTLACEIFSAELPWIEKKLVPIMFPEILAKVYHSIQNFFVFLY